MTTRDPFLQVYDALNNDEDLAELLYGMRSSNREGENMIFTFSVKEEYQKYEYAPILRLTPISMIEKIWNDNDSNLYELVFSVEVFTPTITKGFDISTYIINKYKYEHNCIMLSQNTQYDDTTDLYNSFMKFKIYINKGEIL